MDANKFFILGLEYLTMIDQLIIKQRLEMLEAVAGVLGYGLETANKYKIKNSLGQVHLLKNWVKHCNFTSLKILECL